MKFGRPFTVYSHGHCKTVSLILPNYRGNNDNVPFSLSVVTLYGKERVGRTHWIAVQKSPKRPRRHFNRLVLIIHSDFFRSGRFASQNSAGDIGWQDIFIFESYWIWYFHRHSNHLMSKIIKTPILSFLKPILEIMILSLQKLHKYVTQWRRAHM